MEQSQRAKASSTSNPIDWQLLHTRELARTASLEKQIATLERAVPVEKEAGENKNKKSGDGVPPEALWDASDEVERCTVCNFEVVRGICQSAECGTEHERWPDLQEDEDLRQGVFTWDAYIGPDRFPQARGSTPLLNVELDATEELPKGWFGTWEMYEALLARGATRLMIATFQMTFAKEEGIVAWADEEIYTRFSGPGMKNGDQWKIMLGRRIKLETDDLDGSLFIEELLEDAITYEFPADPMWETVRVRPGSTIWVTKPIGERHNEGSIASDSEDDAGANDRDEFMDGENEGENGNRLRSLSPVLHFDEYEPSDIDPEDLPNMEDEPVLTLFSTPARDSGSDSDFERDYGYPTNLTNQEDGPPGHSATEGVKAEPNGEDVNMSSSDSDQFSSDWDSNDDMNDDDEI